MVNKAQQRKSALPKQQYFVEQLENFVGGKFRDNWASHENNENIAPTKISCYTVQVPNIFDTISYGSVVVFTADLYIPSVGNDLFKDE